MEISEGIEDILRRKERHTSIMPIEKISDVAKQDPEVTTQILNAIEETYIQLASLKSILRAGGATSLKELKENLTPKGIDLERAISSCIDQGLVERVDTPRKSGLLPMFLRIIGRSRDLDPTCRLTYEGRILAERF